MLLLNDQFGDIDVAAALAEIGSVGGGDAGAVVLDPPRLTVGATDAKGDRGPFVIAGIRRLTSVRNPAIGVLRQDHTLHERRVAHERLRGKPRDAFGVR